MDALLSKGFLELSLQTMIFRTKGEQNERVTEENVVT